MRRPTPPDAKRGRIEFDVMKAYSTDQLMLVGTIALVWNQVESMIDWLVFIALDLDLSMYAILIDRVSGMDAKVEILRHFAKNNKILNDEARVAIGSCLEAFKIFKGYRDGIVHSHVFDPESGIALYPGRRRAVVDQVLVTREALQGVYDRLVLFLEELREVDLLFRLGNVENAVALYAPMSRDRAIQRRTQDVLILLPQVLERQKRRQSLPQLPEFPDKD